MDGREDRAPPRVRRRLIMVRPNGHDLDNSGKHAVSHPRHLADSIASRSACRLPCRALQFCPNSTAGPQNWHNSWPIGSCGDSAALPVARPPPSLPLAPRNATDLRPHALTPQPSGGGRPRSRVHLCSPLFPWNTSSDHLGAFRPPVVALSIAPINPPRYTHLAWTSTPKSQFVAPLPGQSLPTANAPSVT